MDSAGGHTHSISFESSSVGGNRLNNISRFGSGSSFGRLGGEIEHGLSSDRMELNPLSGSYYGSLGSGASSLVGSINRMSSSIGQGIDRVGSHIDRRGVVMDCLGSSARRIVPGMGSPMSMEYSPNFVASNLDRMSMGYGVDRLGSSFEQNCSSIERMGSSLHHASSGIDRVDVDHLGTSTFDLSLDRMGGIMDRLPPIGLLGTNSIPRMGLDNIGSNTFDRVGSVLGVGSSMGLRIGSNFDRPLDINQSNTASHSGGTAEAWISNFPRMGCQIFVRNLPFDCTWKMLKDQFSEFGNVVYADIKMENGKSKGCGVVKFDSPEAAQKACCMMNGVKFGPREIDVRMDRNAYALCQ